MSLEEAAELLAWIEVAGAQVWPTKQKGEVVSWTCQVIRDHKVIQPTKTGLVEAIAEARLQYNEAFGFTL